eukprot:Rhum_TRINITY_DN15056_c4_g1::Rhum_TRINITY_DN15056_c4_g1_i8::g.135341::m.135341
MRQYDVNEPVELLWDGQWQSGFVCEVRKGGVYGVVLDGQTHPHFVGHEGLRPPLKAAFPTPDPYGDLHRSRSPAGYRDTPPRVRSETSEVVHMDAAAAGGGGGVHFNPLDAYHETATVSDGDTAGGRLTRHASVRTQAQLLATPAALLIKYLQVAIQRQHVYRGFVAYSFFLVLFTVYMGFMYISEGDEGTYNMNTALRKNLMEDDTFKEISTHDEFYDWLRATSKNFWVTKAEYDRAVAAAGTSVDGLRGNRTRTLLVGIDRVQTGNGLFAERQNYPLHFMMLRQKRVQVQPCGSRSKQAAPLQAELWQRIENSCIDKLSESDREVAYLRKPSAGPVVYASVTTDPFATDDQKPFALPPMRASRGRTSKYSGDDKLYSAKLPYQELFLGDVEKIVSDLKANDWIDFTTRVVVVETMVYNAVQHRYVVLRYVVEFTHSGRVTAFSTSEPFWLMFFDGGGWHIFAFICDLLFSLYFFFSLYLLWSRLFVSWLLGMENLALWKIWDSVYLLATGSLGVCLVYRFLIWGRSQSMADLSGTDLYEDMLSYQELFAWAKHWSTATFWLSFLRFYEYLTYAELCHLRVAEGIRLAAWDLFAIFILGIVITLGFGLVANVIYGWHMREFNTIGDAVSWLLRTVFSGDLASYYEMRDFEPVWTPIFLLIYLILTWLILLNVVLGILAAGFNAASSSTTDREWSAQNLKKDLVQLFRTAVLGQDEGASQGRARGAGTEKEDADGTKQLSFYEKRIACMSILREYLAGHRARYNERSGDGGREFSELSVMVSLEQIMGMEGWCMTREETIYLMRGANSLVVDSFRDAEEQKRAEKEQLTNQIAAISAQMQQSMQTMLRRAVQDIDARVDALEEKIDVNNDRVAGIEDSFDRQMNEQTKQQAEESLRIMGAVSAHRKHLDSIAASIFDSESRVRGDIQKRPFATSADVGFSRAAPAVSSPAAAGLGAARTPAPAPPSPGPRSARRLPL